MDYRLTVVTGDQDNGRINGDEWQLSPLADAETAPDLVAWLDTYTATAGPGVWVLVTPADAQVGDVLGVRARGYVVPGPEGYTLTADPQD